MSGEFSVYWWDDQGAQHTEYRYVDINVVKSAIMRLCKGPAAILGIVNRVMVTDGGDNACFDWNKTDGVVFPPAGEGDGQFQS